MKWHIILFLAVAVASALPAPAEKLPDSSPASSPATDLTKPLKFTVSRETTYITQPLLPDGRPDYIAYLNEEFGKGVTSENNAAVLLLEAWGPGDSSDTCYRLALEKLLPQGSKNKTFFQRFPGKKGEEEFQEAQKKPWNAKDHPNVAKWLADNAKPLELIVEASKRPRLFFPRIKVEREDPVATFFSSFPSFWYFSFRATNEALVIRSHLAMAEGRWDDAWADLLAGYRLGNLLAQRSWAMDQLIARANFSLVDEAAINLAQSKGIPTTFLERMLREIPACSLTEVFPQVVSKGERFSNLSMLLEIAQQPATVESLKTLYSFYWPKDKIETYWRVFRRDTKKVDADFTLRRMNEYYDALSAEIRLPTYTERQQAQADRKKETDRILKESEIQEGDQYTQELLVSAKANGVNAPTQWAGNIWIYGLNEGLFRAQTLMDQARVKHDMVRIAIALEIYKAKKGKYPRTLAELSPEILPTVPEDFFRGGPFTYKPSDSGYVLYSVGRNAKDDGGKDAPFGEEGDIVIQSAP